MVVLIGRDRLEEASLTTETGQPLDYSHTYAKELGQYLLNEGILVCLLEYSNDQANSGSGLESSSTEQMRAINTTHHAVPEDSRQVPFGMTFRGHTPQSPSTPNSPQSLTYLHEVEVEPARPRKFQNNDHCLYRFVDMEDRESGYVFHSMQVLPAALSSRPARSHHDHNQWQERQRRREMSEFDRARLATQVVIAGVLQQRARNDKVAKEFLARPLVLHVLESVELNSRDFYKLLRI